ncbi:hypothetical protein V5E97_09320 [Singulisphaera sp. Ch08]|uniref:Leucine-rich repeat domain-containing protein n=1 Tax=Singulisphaera sp. Ch08 TaxID=3120278 RepID=A0AAU7CLX8_9BACT
MVHLEAMNQLEILKLGALPIGDVGLASIGKLTRLRELELDPCDISRVTDAGAIHFRGLARLVKLDLTSQALTDAGLASFTGMTDLEELDLSYNQGIVGPGLVHLKDLPKLKRLNLIGTKVSDAALPVLVVLASRTYLDLRNTRVTEDGQARLANALL